SQTLSQQTEARPEFVARRETLDADWRRIEELEAELERLRRRISEQERSYCCEVRDATERTHGHRAMGTGYGIRIKDPDTIAQLSHLRALGDEDAVRETLLKLMGCCLWCTHPLDEEDQVPGEPGMRYVLCAWCREHGGNTHCFDCQKPLSEG